MSDKFQLLLKQIRFPKDHKTYNEIKDGSIHSVKLSKSKRRWFFVFTFQNVLSSEGFNLFNSLLQSTFNSLGAEVSYEFILESSSCDNDLLSFYFSYALESLKVSHFSLYSLFSNLNVEFFNKEILVKAPSHIFRENVQDRFIFLVSNVLSNVGLSDVKVSVLEDKEVSSSFETAYETNKVSLQEQAESQAKQVLQSIVESEPVSTSRLEQSPKYTEKQSQRQASFDKAEITPMIDVNSEENRIVFEGYIFDVEQRETKTGRIIINFKVTDYTSSFAMQRWAKDSEELAKFDMIKKGNWVRVRGRIENNPYTHSLTMNVQDIKEISHTPRKDLMPEGQKRVEFHAHTNMSTMDAMPTVEELIDTAASWGHTAVAITDHANVQSFPHGYHRAKKAGIKAIFGLEANLVEDKVPIVYNSEELELKEATYVVFDVETTGLSAVHNDLIQIAASKMHKGNIIEQFDEFINPGYPLSAFTTELTGITDNHVKGAKPLLQVLQEFQDFCQGTVLVAHNATFDVGFMNANYERNQLPTISQPVIDTLEFARNLYPEYKRHGLGPLTKRFGVALDHHHMANYDAEATGRLLFIFIKDVFDKHGLTNLEQLNTELVSEDSYKKSRIKHATLYVQNQTGLKNIFKLVSLSNVSYFEGVARIPRTVLDEYREGIIVGSACADGEVFDTLLSHGIEKAVEVAKYYDFIEVMPPAIYAPLIAKDLIKDEATVEQLIRDLIEVANRLDKPVLATGNVHYINPEDAIYREIIVRALGQGAMINRPIGKGENAKPAPLPEAHFRTTNEMLDDFAFLGKELAYEVVVTNTQAMANRIEEVEVVKKDLYTPFIDRAEEQVAEMTYA
ncbi:PolC-type DNA polymerase III, partial [Streptococcus sp.]|uniref:PolC-type DNA polymerase III n=1 Tax=Streptococcus sp. TaxID=1306 RepID=UPI0025E80151